MIDLVLDVLIVDDSRFFQTHLKEIVNAHPQLNVVGIAKDGVEAIEKIEKLEPDIVTMDYEMPRMDGVTAVRHIMAKYPLPILMLSSMTFEGAKITLDALAAGAADFMTKNFSAVANKNPQIKQRIYDVLLAIGKKRLAEKQLELRKKNVAEEQQIHSTSLEHMKTASKSSYHQQTPKKDIEIVAIGASTGGPVALTQLLKSLPANFPYPIILVQHMPENFTLAFADRLNQDCALHVKEAINGDQLTAGKVLLAPGGQQLVVNTHKPKQVAVIEDRVEGKDIQYKPSLDITFASLANTYGRHCLGIILTGMGSDGCRGAGLLKAEGATIWTQSEESCLIYGMPMAVDKANLSDASYDIEQLKSALLKF